MGLNYLFRSVNRENVKKRPAGLVLALALLGACTPMEWTRSGADAATTESDLSACSRQAWMRAQSGAFYGQSYLIEPIVQRDRKGRPFVNWGTRPFPDPQVREQTLFNLCMRDRGYAYVPVKPLQ